ncbi:MAG: hypothetical protein WBR18_02305 [Anaerolineales bacterium]
MGSKRLTIVLLSCAIAIYGCAGSPSGQEETVSESSASASQGGSPTATADVEATAASQATATLEAFGPMLPVPINEGLASLNSFRMTYTNDVYDSVPDQRSVITFVIAQDRDADARYLQTENLITTEDYEVTSRDVEEQYVVGNDVCYIRNGQAQFKTMSDSGRQIMEMMMQTIAINPMIENPEFEGRDSINGVDVRTYTFQITSADVGSSTETAKSEGHYALAEDGDYLVDYRLDMELRTAPEGDESAEYSVSFFDLALEDIDEPLEIVLPQTCEAASAFGAGLPQGTFDVPFGQ